MQRITIIAAAAAISLAGCSGGNPDADGNGTVSVKEAAKAAQAEMPKPKPGLYKTTIVMTDLQIPGMPPEMKGHGAGMTRTMEECLTQEKVDKGYEALIKQGQDGDCSYEKFNAAGGKIDAVMVCQSQGRSARMTMSGTTTETSADLNATMAMDFDGAGEGTMTFTAKHERIGDCPAK